MKGLLIVYGFIVPQYIAINCAFVPLWYKLVSKLQAQDTLGSGHAKAIMP